MKPIHFLLLLFLLSCKSKEQKPKLTDEQMKHVYAKELNNRAIDTASEHENDINVLNAAIRLLDSAIKLVPDYSTAILNKGRVLLQKKDTDGVLHINHILMMKKPIEAGYSFQRGYILERRGDTVGSKYFYQQGLQKYRSYFTNADTAHPIELFMLIEYAEFLSFAGLQKESMERLKQAGDDPRSNEAYKKYKLRTKEEWFRMWTYHTDGTDYYKLFDDRNKMS